MSAEVIQLSTGRRRTLNVTGSEVCDRCDHGHIVVGSELRPVVRVGRQGAVVAGEYRQDVVGPCPFCELGFRLEFGIGRKNGADYTNPDGGPWGKSGFWQGRDPEQLGVEATG